LSLKESQANASSSRAISISDSEDDDDDRFRSELLQAIQASKTESSMTTTQSVRNPEPLSQSAPSRSTPAASFLSERAQMEKERLERLKRVRGQDSNDESRISPTAKRQHIPSSEIHANGRANIASASSSSVPSDSSASSRAASTAVNQIPTSEQLFWNGELRPTANKHSQPRQDGKSTFRLTEVLGSVRVGSPVFCIHDA
jgi:tyrosyl-DNA phosphodiesterase-1